MTKTQKVDDVTATVQNARRYYTFEEYATMFQAIWNGLEAAKAAAIEPAPEPTPGPNV